MAISRIKEVIKMRITNRYNLPENIVNAIKAGIYKPRKDRVGVSQLINAPLIRQLTLKHWDNLEEDVSDRLWALLGTSVHYILEKGTPENAFGEEKLIVNTPKGTISGKSDLYHNEEVSDWKITSVYSFLLGAKPEWEAQLNVYKWLWEQNGFVVKKLTINAILRDWVRSKTLIDPEYPKIPFKTINVPMWDKDKIHFYILNRLELHSKEPLECTPEEKWVRPTTWAVMEEGKKRAKRVLDTEEKAMKWLEDNSDFYIDILEGLYLVMKKGLKKPKGEFMTKEEALDHIKEEETLYVVKRKGINVKCESYCNVSAFCPFYENKA